VYVIVYYLHYLQYDVKDLIELCDVNLYRAATESNVGDILKVAKRNGLLKVQEN